MNLPLRADADGERASEILRDLVNEAGNARGGDMYQRYVAWTENAERMLRNAFEAEAVTDLVHTQRYWMLRAIPPGTPRLAPLVDAELTNRASVLTQLQDDLQEQRRRWRHRAATLVVVDTNMFLEPGRPIQEVDWLVVTDSRPGVRLVVPLIVVHELDRLKRQGNNTTARLARDAIRWLAKIAPFQTTGQSELLSGDQLRGVTIEIAIHDGPRRLDDPDGFIIDFTRRLKIVSNMFTKMATRDLGMQLSARAKGVDALLLEKKPDQEADDVLRT